MWAKASSTTTLTLAVLLLAGFLTASLFGAAVSLVRNEHGQMTSCSFMQGHVAWCAGNPLSHLASWQSAFSTILPLLAVFLLLVAVMTGIALPFSRQKMHPFLHSLSDAASIVPLPLAFAFSNGILHPKVF